MFSVCGHQSNLGVVFSSLTGTANQTVDRGGVQSGSRRQLENDCGTRNSGNSLPQFPAEDILTNRHEALGKAFNQYG